MSKRIVIALGGNALGDNPTEQLARIREAAPALLGVIDKDTEIVITHGNGPQVGMIQKAFAIASEQDPKVPSIDLPECGAMSQGYIGYHLQQGLGDEIRKMGKDWKVATVVTQVEVDPNDPSFQNPTKPIGAFMTKEQAEAAAAEDPTFTYVEDSGRGYRRVVASPQPKAIVERDAILELLDNEFIVISCGGGGIPVIREADGTLKGRAAVIDKDNCAELLAEDCDAEVLFLLTAVEHVAINFGKPDQVELSDLSVEEAEKYCEEGQFGKGSMEPKVRAGIKFAKSAPGRVCIIGSLDKAPETIKGENGTVIHA